MSGAKKKGRCVVKRAVQLLTLLFAVVAVDVAILGDAGAAFALIAGGAMAHCWRLEIEMREMDRTVYRERRVK